MNQVVMEAPPLSDVLRSVIDRCGYPVLGQDAIDALAPEEPLVMLFFAGNFRRHMQSDDVAAVLPELDKALAGHAQVFVVDPADQRSMQRRYHFTSYPTLVFLREGGFLGMIEGIRDWSDYLVEIPEILNREPHDPPPFQLPEGCNGSN